MKILVCAILLFLSLQTIASENLSDYLHKQELLSHVKKITLEHSIENGIWDDSKSAFAFCIPDSHSICLVILKLNLEFKMVNVSVVEDGNFGKLGNTRTFYTKFITNPSKWLKRADKHYQINFITNAWRDKQKYSVQESMIINQDGNFLVR